MNYEDERRQYWTCMNHDLCPKPFRGSKPAFPRQSIMAALSCQLQEHVWLRRRRRKLSHCLISYWPATKDCVAELNCGGNEPPKTSTWSWLQNIVRIAAAAGGGSLRSLRYLKQHRPADPYDAGDLLALWYLVTGWDRWNLVDFWTTPPKSSRTKIWDRPIGVLKTSD